MKTEVPWRLPTPEENMEFRERMDRENAEDLRKIAALRDEPYTEDDIKRAEAMLDMGESEGACDLEFRDANVFIARILNTLRNANR